MSNKHGRSKFVLQKSTRELAVSSNSMLSSFADHVPVLPRDAVKRAVRFAARLPERPRLVALNIVAGKLAHDFAFRFLLLLDGVIQSQTRHEEAQVFDPQDAGDMEVVTNLLESWMRLPEALRIRNDVQFKRFTDATAGLQGMIEATPSESQLSWVFDSERQYRSMLLRIDAIPQVEVKARMYAIDREIGGIHVEMAHFEPQHVHKSDRPLTYMTNQTTMQPAFEVPSSLATDAQIDRTSPVS